MGVRCIWRVSPTMMRISRNRVERGPLQRGVVHCAGVTNGRLSYRRLGHPSQAIPDSNTNNAAALH